MVSLVGGEMDSEVVVEERGEKAAVKKAENCTLILVPLGYNGEK